MWDDIHKNENKRYGVGVNDSMVTEKLKDDVVKKYVTEKGRIINPKTHLSISVRNLWKNMEDEPRPEI